VADSPAGPVAQTSPRRGLPRRERIATGYAPRPLQRHVHRNLRRFNVLVCHRRFGKTVLAVNELVHQSLLCPLPAPRHAYLAPLRKQAKRVAWDYLKHYTARLPWRRVVEGELRIDLPGGRCLFLDGADNPDALRGLYLDGVVLDEYGQMPAHAWREVVRPALADRQGTAIFIGTPKGRNAFHDLYSGAEAQSAELRSEWFAALFRASETGVVPAAELAAAWREMDDALFAQELMAGMLGLGALRSLEKIRGVAK
jgi:phage terminase large subunit